MGLFVNFHKSLVISLKGLGFLLQLLKNVLVSDENPFQIHPLLLDSNPNVQSVLYGIEVFDPGLDFSLQIKSIFVAVHILQCNEVIIELYKQLLFHSDHFTMRQSVVEHQQTLILPVLLYSLNLTLVIALLCSHGNDLVDFLFVLP